MSEWKTIPIGQAIQFNPPESIKKGVIAKKIAMGKLTEFQRKINGFELSDYSAGPKFRNGDTLVAKITPCIENGKTAFVDILDKDEVAFGSSEFIVLRKTSLTDPEFIFYLAISPTFRFRAISCMEGTSGRQRVNENTLKNFELAFPCLIEQQKIAKVLSDLDAKIELNNKINAELEAMAKLIYDYWFVQFEFPNEDGKPYKSFGGKMVWNEELKREIPEGWDVKQLGKILRTELGGTPSTKDKDFWDGEFPWLNSGEIANFPIIDSDLKITEAGIKNSATTLMQKGTCVLSITRHLRPSILGVDSCANQSVVGIFESEKLKNSFIYPYLVNDIPRLMTLRSGAQQPHINKGTVDDSKMIIPNEMILNKYYSIVDSYYDKILNNAFQIKQLAELRDWLLPMLMNGQVKVSEL